MCALYLFRMRRFFSFLYQTQTTSRLEQTSSQVNQNFGFFGNWTDLSWHKCLISVTCTLFIRLLVSHFCLTAFWICTKLFRWLFLYYDLKLTVTYILHTHTNIQKQVKGIKGVRISNWSDTFECNPELYFTPQNVEELREASDYLKTLKPLMKMHDKWHFSISIEW